MGIISDIKKALGIGGASGRQKRIDTFISNAEKGVNTPGATLGNPAPTPRKKKKLKPVSSRTPSTLRG